jgi:L-rhamnose-H+ transport protein
MAAIVMMVGFKVQQHQKAGKITIPTHLEFGLIALMGLLFTGSIACYSLAMSHANHIGKEISWPLFMVSIILTSQLWGIKFKEFHFDDNVTKWRILLSIVLMFMAIILLATQN